MTYHTPSTRRTLARFEPEIQMSTLRSPSRLALGLATAMLLATTASADVWIVDAAGGGDFIDLPAAVAAAADGDALLVHAGSYSGFDLVGKGLSILAMGGTAHVGHVRLESIPAGSSVLLDGLEIVAPEWWDAFRRNGVNVVQVQASVRIQDCSIRGVAPWLAWHGEPPVHGVHVSDSTDVTIVRCDLHGGEGPPWASKVSGGGAGGAGLFAKNSRVAVHDSLAIGGDGGDGDGGGNAGAGAEVTGSAQVLVAVGAVFRGGRGGADLGGIFGSGDGGHGLWARQQSKARLRAVDPLGGPAGTGSGGLMGQAVLKELSASLILYPGVARTCSSAAIAWEGGVTAVQIHGAVGDRVWLPASQYSLWTFVAPLAGAWTLPAPILRPLVPGGVIPSSGSLTLKLSLPELAPGETHRPRFFQGLVLDSTGQPFTGTPGALLILDCTRSSDCNANGTPDACEIQSGATSDCNANGVPDGCDIAAGTSVDLDGDGTPDECQ